MSFQLEGGGNPIFMDSSGKIFLCDHGTMQLLAKSFEQLSKKNFLNGNPYDAKHYKQGA